jgi:hypothetical protein
MKNIYELKLHEILVIEDKYLLTTVLKVPGGWIYRSYDKENKILGSVFVPFNTEWFNEGLKPE